MKRRPTLSRKENREMSREEHGRDEVMKRALVRTLLLQRRRGAVMVFALMALLVASMMIAALLRTAAMSHQQLKRDEFRIQASLLADSGCDRALAILRRRPDFTGGEWIVPAEQLAPERTAIVRMTVTSDPNQPNQRLVAAVAEYPSGHPHLVRITRQMPIR